MTSSVLYRWPPSTAFGRVVPKTKFYEHGNITATVRQRFVEEVQRITWAFKLAETTINLPGTKAVPEIQVFVLDAKEEDIGDAVLSAIDKTIPLPVIFEVNVAKGARSRTRMTAAHKWLGGTQPKLSPYFSTEWVPSSFQRVPLPTALDLPSLYAGLLTPILPIVTRPGEQLSAATVRLGEARKLEREIKALQRKVRNEPQFNRKVELRRALKDRTVSLTALTDPAPSNAKNDPQKDSPWTI